MASSTLARFTLKPSILRSVAFRPSAYSIWTLSTAAAQKQQQTNHHQQLSLVRNPVIITLKFFYLFPLKVSGVRWVAPARLYSVSGLTKDAVESRVLTVCKAFDKITADKVNSCIFDLASIWQFFLPKVFIFNLVLWQSNLTNFFDQKVFILNLVLWQSNLTNFLTKKCLFWI